MGGERFKTVEELLEGISLDVPAGQKIQVSIGDTLRVRASIEYMGPAISDTFYGAIGNRGAFGFDEILKGSVPISFPQCLSWTPFQLTVDIPITSAISPGTNYDLYVKLVGHLEAGLPEFDNVIDVLGAVQFRNFMIVSYEKV